MGIRTEWTASVTTLCRSRSVSVESLPANGPTHPRRFGLIPPVTFGVCVVFIYYYDNEERCRMRVLEYIHDEDNIIQYYVVCDCELTHQTNPTLGTFFKVRSHFSHIMMIIITCIHGP